MSKFPPVKHSALSSVSPISQSVRAAESPSALRPHARLTRYVRESYRRLVRPWWAWEIFAAIVSLAATISLVIVLSQANNKRPPSWVIGGTRLTVNTIVAGIGTVLRTALLLAVAGALNQSAWNWFASLNGKPKSDGRPLKDLETFSDASANSWNCIKLLWRTKCRYLVTIGALVMILSLSFDAFLQQILSTEQQPQQITLTGSNLTADNILPRSTAYHYNSSTDPIAVTHWNSVMTAALAQTNWSLPDAVCPTGNCAWPVTPSLATCHECKSLTPAIIQHFSPGCNDTNYALPSLLTNPGLLNITIPELLEVNITVIQCEDGGGEATWMLDSANLFDIDPRDSDSGDTTITRLYSFGTSPELKTGLPWETIAYECSISFCIKGYTGFVSDGSGYISTIKDVGREAQYKAQHNGSVELEFVNVPATLNMAESNPITVDESFRLVLNSAAQLMFSGTVYMKPEGNVNGSSDYTWQSGSDLVGFLHEASSSLEDFTAIIGKISDGMTDHIRTTSYVAPSSLYAPTMTVSAPIVVVRWPWLIYVLVLQFSGLIFLLLTIQATNRRRVRAWKGHRMALLLSDLDPSLRDKAQGGLSHRTGLDDRIGETKVRLEFDGDDRIAFRCVDQEICKSGNA